MLFIIFASNLFIFFVNQVSAFDIETEGHIITGSQYIFNSPPLHKDFDSSLELHFVTKGSFLKTSEWALDYAFETNGILNNGPSEQSNLSNDNTINILRSWLNLSKGPIDFRGGRQDILFGSGVIFRPLGFFDTLNISGVLPEAVGVDSFRATWFQSDTSLIEAWLVPAKIDSALISGIRGEMLLGSTEIGTVFQYHPKSNLVNFLSYEQDMVQIGYYFKGENKFGFWNETRLDIEMQTTSPMKFDTVLGIDYTFDIGEGLHVLAEYFLTTQQKEFTVSDLKGHKTYQQIGFAIDQPIGIDIKWQVFSMLDLRDSSFQINPQIELSVTDTLFLYFYGKIGSKIKGTKQNGRLYQRTNKFNGTESSVGLILAKFL
jgi:hypothetical protein